MKTEFDRNWREKFNEQHLLDRHQGQLPHLISDNATMQILRWTPGGFGLAMHN